MSEAFAYYNEHDPFAAQWLRNLIAAQDIPLGFVDDRSIWDVRPEQLAGYRQCHFFAGIGIWSHALRGAGWPDHVPVWTGSCPCQPFSVAGKGGGLADERHLWPAWLHNIRVCRPAVILGEQVAAKIALAWLDVVQADLEALGYACGAVPFPAAGVGAPSKRERLYFAAVHPGVLADAGGFQLQRCIKEPHVQRGSRVLPAGGDGVGDDGPARGACNGFWSSPDWLRCDDGYWRPVESRTFPLDTGDKRPVEELIAYGNALCAPQAEEFVRAVMQVLG